ncbi:hypothetical protein [Nonomuraea sp. NPDC049309]|uniref:hypothetical protein n=1 Tax=Nonomuraea sp. NPDC049309 TaxID=3364350 RepID=UPI0037247C43
MTTPLEPVPLHAPDEVLDDLRRRPAMTGWTPDPGNDDGRYRVRRDWTGASPCTWPRT